MSTALRVKELTYTFAGRDEPTLRGLDFELPPGSWTLVAGCTGSGKSTLLRALCGLIPHHTSGRMEGVVELFGRSTRDTSPAQLASTVGLVQQSPDDQICSTTVLAEVAFGLENLAIPAREIGPRIEAALRQVGLEYHSGDRTHQLSGGQKQRLMLAALLAMRPRLLLLDEPLSQLDPHAALRLLELLEKLRGEGLTIVMAEHRHDELLARVDQVMTLDRGKLVGEASTKDPAAVVDAFAVAGLRLPEIAQLALAARGKPVFEVSSLVEVILRHPRQHKQSVERTTQPRGESLLEVESLTFRFPDRPHVVFSEINFHLHHGDRVALVGPNGAGKSTLLHVLAGLWLSSAGGVRESVTDATLAAAAPIPQRDRKSKSPSARRGLLLQQPDLMLFCRSVRDELAFGPRQLGLALHDIDARVAAAAEMLSLGPHLDQSPQSLSQGERLRTALAATLTLSPGLLLLDEPTTGQDQANVDQIMELVCQRLPAECVVFSTHDVRSVARYANRVLVLAPDLDDDRSQQRAEVIRTTGPRPARLIADCHPAQLLDDDRLLAAAGLRRPPLYEVRRLLGLRGLSVEAMLAELPL